jgi:hypothetical protein
MPYTEKSPGKVIDFADKDFVSLDENTWLLRLQG